MFVYGEFGIDIDSVFVVFRVNSAISFVSHFVMYVNS